MSRSIYQSNGKPLSAQAVYQQKLRQGIYTSPNIGNVGVNSSASDTAALLAASTDLTVKPSYERTIAPEAHDAALAAKLEKIYEWSRTVDINAENAAVSSLYGSDNKSNGKSGTMTSSLGVPSVKGSSIYKVANENSTTTMTSRINPEKNYKHGLKPNSSIVSLDISKISNIANANSTKTLDSRINPEYNVGRSGLTTKTGRAKSFQAGDISGKYLLSAASEKANDRLSSLKNGKPEDFKAQAQLYANALAIAQKRSDERIKSHKAGVVDLGGGLTVTQSELDKMASLIVGPVISDINSKAKQQRDQDKQKELKKQELVKQHEEAKKLELQEKQQEKEDLEKAKQERITKNEAEKKVKDDEYVTYQGEENDKVTAKQAELTEQEKVHAEKREELLNQKQANQDEIDQEEQEKIAARKEELEAMQKERDTEIEPILSELKVETDKLTDVTNAKNELSEEVDKLDTLNKEYLDKIKELEDKLAETEADIETTTKDLEESDEKLASTTKDLDALHESANKHLEEIKQESTKLDSEIDELTKTKESHLAEKSAKKEEIKSQLNERVKDEHAINNELPDHLKKTVDEKKLLDTSSIFSDEPVVESKPEPVESKPSESKAPATPTTATKKDKEKVSTRKRISGFFKRKSLPSAVSTVAAAGATGTAVAKSTAEKTASSTSNGLIESTKKGVEQGQKAGKQVINDSLSLEKLKKDKQDSEEFVDDLSIQNNNKGGLFKEEI